MSNETNELVHFRLTQVEEKINKVESKLNEVVVNSAVMKTELSAASSKTSSIISVVISLVIGFIGYKLQGM